MLRSRQEIEQAILGRLSHVMSKHYAFVHSKQRRLPMLAPRIILAAFIWLCRQGTESIILPKLLNIFSKPCAFGLRKTCPFTTLLFRIVWAWPTLNSQ